MKYYISQINLRYGHPTKGEDYLVADEKIITKADTEKTTKNSLRRLTNLGIEDLYMVKYERKRYNRLMREQNRKTRAVTLADVADAMKEFSSEAENSCQSA